MININDFYTRLNDDLILKGKGGYISGDEFNRSVRDAQHYFYSFLVHKMKQDRRVSDALSVLRSESNLTISGDLAPLPSDYGHKEDWYIKIKDTGCNGNQTVHNNYPLDELKSGEYSNLLNSAIRKPSIANNKYAAEIFPDNIRIYPSGVVGQVYLKYLKMPPVATWGYTLDGSNDQENYDVSTSVNLVWRQTEFNELMNIMLYLKGMQIKDSEVVNWITANRQIVEAQ